MPRFSIAAAAANMAQYLSQSQSAQLKAAHGGQFDRTHLYWPGLQGLVANPMAWRERLGSSKYKFQNIPLVLNHISYNSFRTCRIVNPLELFHA